MNNKGFTLVELLAVVLILTSISLIAVSGISASLERRNSKEYDEQKELAINAAKIYFSLVDDANCVKDGNTIPSCVYVKDLIDQNYFNERSKTDRLKDKDNSCVKMKSGEYKFEEECSFTVD